MSNIEVKLKKDGTPMKKRGRPPKNKTSTEVLAQNINDILNIKKKRGRPSKAEKLQQEQLRIEKENEIKQKILNEKPLAKKEQTVVTNVEEIKQYPLFVYMQKVESINNKEMKGYVQRQDLNSPKFVFVKWNDGTCYWCEATLLTAIEDNKKKRKEK